MKKIQIADITLREEASNPNFSLSFKEKLELAKELDKLGVDVVETAPIEPGSQSDALLVRTIARLVKKSAVACPVGYTVKSVEEAWNSVMSAVKPRLVVSLPVSAVQMEYVCRLKPDKILELIRELVSASAALCGDVEFCAEDATRADMAFLCDAVKAAMEAGATTITVCDTAGTMMPDEFAGFISDMYGEIPALETATLAARCSDQLKMSVATSFEAIANGVDQLKTTVAGSSCTSLEAIAHVFRDRGDTIGVSCGLDMTTVTRTMQRMDWMVNPDGVSMVKASATTIEDAYILDSTADISTVAAALARQGYDLSDEDMARVYEAFGLIAAKKAVGPKEMDAIVASSALQVAPTYKLVSYVINSGNIITATANIEVEKCGGRLVGLANGDGPIDAAFRAVEQLVGRHYELDDFQIQAVTEGREAMGSALVKLRENGHLFSGQGISTDIIGASIRAYLDALNKIVYEENI